MSKSLTSFAIGNCHFETSQSVALTQTTLGAARMNLEFPVETVLVVNVTAPTPRDTASFQSVDLQNQRRLAFDLFTAAGAAMLDQRSLSRGGTNVSMMKVRTLMLHYGAAGVMDVQQRQTTHFYLAPPVCVCGGGGHAFSRGL